MPNRWKTALLSFLAASSLFTSCKKNFSSDDPLPATYNPSVIISSDNGIVYAFDPITGSKNWELALPVSVIASPILYGGMVYVSSANTIGSSSVAVDTIYKINAKTGVLVKKMVPSPNPAGSSYIATPIADGKNLYVCNTQGYVYALDTGTGAINWYYQKSGDNGIPIEASPVIFNNYIYIVYKNGDIACLDKTLGGIIPSGGSTAEIWTLSIPGATFHSSPSIAPPYMYLGSMSDSNMYCVRLDAPSATPGIGAVRWTFKTHGNILSSPATYGGTCIFGCSDFNVYCIDTTIDPSMGINTPDMRWKTPTSAEVEASPFCYNQVVYAASKDYKLYAINVINGGVKWRFATNGLIKSSPLAYKNMVYVGSYDRNFYAVDTTTGTLIWQKGVNGAVECSPVLDDFTKLTGYNSQISGFTN